MVRYAAFLRGIAPLNPNMKNERLREVFEREGMANVQTVISSGNVLFESDEQNVDKLEARIEKALPEQLGFNSMTIILSEAELRRLDEHNVYKREEEAKSVRLVVSFTKQQAHLRADAPHKTDDRHGFGILGVYERAVYWRVDQDAPQATVLMRWLEKEYGQAITTRNWNTVERILKKWDAQQ